ncbi:MAG: carbohydrate-binding domain-containing protein [Williamsia sp.]|nr:carbohydrate-binding domain-containing protein [Williamsia sp.]
MKHLLSIIGLLFICCAVHAQNIRVHNSGDTMYANAISSVDSIKFDSNYSRFKINGVGSTLNIQKALIDSITFSNNAVASTKIYIVYNGTDNATIINPYASQGVAITASGGTVAVTAASGISNLEYNLLGTSATGSLTMSSTSPASFIMNNLNITNASGPAINITGGQTHAFISKAGTTNSLTDGTGNTKNSTLQTDGKIVFSGTGSLVLKGIKKHGISTTSSIEMQSSTVTVIAAASDGFHSEGFVMSGGTATIAASASDGIDAGDGAVSITNGSINITSTAEDVKALKTGNAAMAISGGTLNLNVSGSASKAISAKGAITINAGLFTINLSGAALLTASGSGYNTSYCSGIKSDDQINVNGGSISIQATAAANGARGFSGDSGINISGGTIVVSVAGNGATYKNTTGATDSYAAAAFSSDKAINITGGAVTTTSSGTGGKGLKSDGTITIGSASGSPVLNIITTGARFLVSGTDYNHPKTIVANGPISILNGTTTLASTDDGIHSDASITISGGNNKVTASSSTSGVGEGIEAPIINIAGGVTNVTASNDGINATYGTVSGGTEMNDNSQLNISGGILVVAGSDAIDSNGNITITGGTTVVCGPTSQPEEGIDFNGTFLMNGGILISGGASSNMTKAMSTTSTQVGMFARSSAQLAATSLLHIENAAGTEMVTFKPKNAVYYFHFSSPTLAKNTQYKVYFGGTYTGGSFVGGSTGWGLYTGGTYSLTGATLKSTFTASSASNVNTISF